MAARTQQAITKGELTAEAAHLATELIAKGLGEVVEELRQLEGNEVAVIAERVAKRTPVILEVSPAEIIRQERDRR